MLDPPSDDGPGSAAVMPFPTMVLLEAGLAPLALALGFLFRCPPLADFAWDADAAGLGLIAAMPMLADLAAALRWPVGPLRRIKAFLERELAPALAGCGWPDLALISVAAGVGEEMLFRGVIQGALARAIGPAAAVALAGLVFGLLPPGLDRLRRHRRALLGAYLGLVWLATGEPAGRDRGPRGLRFRRPARDPPRPPRRRGGTGA